MTRRTKARIMRGKLNHSATKSRLINERGGRICAICGNHDYVIELDHIKPLWAGGSNDDSNLQLLCWNCHFEKTKRERKIYHKMNPQKIMVNDVWVNKDRCEEAYKLIYEDLMEQANGTR